MALAWNHVGLSADGYTIRECREDDLGPVLALWRLARSEHAVTADRLEDVAGLIAEQPGGVLVAEANGEVVGALIAAWDGWRGNMYRLAVLPQSRRRGIGLALIRAGEESLRRRGARRVTALVAHDDAVAGAVWDAAGYPTDREIGRRVRNL
jgi:ribosomal protein S18 acetylase RimI-like enzyme